jgi:hypothetical protein
VPLPETQYEFLRAGFLVARDCQRCRATTAWEFTFEDEAGVPSGKERERRAIGRARLQMRIKVLRQSYGAVQEDVCETQNVSRHGAYFLSGRSYQVGETVQAMLPYKEGELAIPVPARVVRVENVKGSNLHGVAIRMETRK